MTNAEFLPFGILSERSELLVRVKERHQSMLALERLSSPRAHSDTIGAGISARVSGRPFPDCLSIAGSFAQQWVFLPVALRGRLGRM
jgi:hypothetical protein